MSSASTIASGVAAGAGSGSFLGPLGTLGGALIGGLGSFFSSKQSSDFAEESYKRRYQWMVKDLKKAGLNPMLAVGASPGQVPQPNFQNVGEGIVKGAQAGQSAKLIESQIRLAEQSADAQQAQAGKAYAEAEGQTIRNRIDKTNPQYIDALKALDGKDDPSASSASAQQKLDSELAILTEQGAKLKADRELVELQKKLVEGDISLQQIRIQFAPALAEIEQRYRDAMAAAAKAGVAPAEAEEAFWKEAGVFGKLAQFLKQIWK